MLLNHVGTVHASAQFALAEASSGEFLLRHLGELQGHVFAVLRKSEVKFRKPAKGTLRTVARFGGANGDSLSAELTSRGRAFASVLVEIADLDGVVTMTGEYDWFLECRT